MLNVPLISVSDLFINGKQMNTTANSCSVLALFIGPDSFFFYLADLQPGQLLKVSTGSSDAPAVLFWLRFLWFTCNYQAFIISTPLWFPFNTYSSLYLNLKGKEWMSLLSESWLGLVDIIYTINSSAYPVAGVTISSIHCFAYGSVVMVIFSVKGVF